MLSVRLSLSFVQKHNLLLEMPDLLRRFQRRRLQVMKLRLESLIHGAQVLDHALLLHKFLFNLRYFVRFVFFEV